MYLGALIVPGIVLRAFGWTPHWTVWVAILLVSFLTAHALIRWFTNRYELHRYYARAALLKHSDPEHFAELLRTMRSFGSLIDGEGHLREQGWKDEDTEVAAVASFLREADRRGLARA